MKKKVAVFFGGRSPEHDVSVITGLQVLNAVDLTKYDPFPVYVSVSGEWLVGEGLWQRNSFLPSSEMRKRLTSVTFDLSAQGQGRLLPLDRPWWKCKKPIEFDVALLAFHGSIGEDGNVQGILETASIPYTGMRTLASAVLMNKSTSKKVFNDLGIPTLPYATFYKHEMHGSDFSPEMVAKRISHLQYPVIVKPNNLGSSIGVAPAQNLEEVLAIMVDIFRMDTSVIIEKFLQDFSEYNLTVMRRDGKIHCSAIEHPKRTEELLSFKEKYCPNGKLGKLGKMGGTKGAGESQGMLSLTRDINPTLDPKEFELINASTVKLFNALGGTGGPRLDYIRDDKTNQMYLNEVNPCCGSFGYFLWEAAKEPISFVQLLNYLLEEAVECWQQQQLPIDLVPEAARLLKR